MGDIHSLQSACKNKGCPILKPENIFLVQDIAVELMLQYFIFTTGKKQISTTAVQTVWSELEDRCASSHLLHRV